MFEIRLPTSDPRQLQATLDALQEAGRIDPTLGIPAAVATGRQSLALGQVQVAQQYADQALRSLQSSPVFQQLATVVETDSTLGASAGAAVQQALQQLPAMLADGRISGAEGKSLALGIAGAAGGAACGAVSAGTLAPVCALAASAVMGGFIEIGEALARAFRGRESAYPNPWRHPYAVNGATQTVRAWRSLVEQVARATQTSLQDRERLALQFNKLLAGATANNGDKPYRAPVAWQSFPPDLPTYRWSNLSEFTVVFLGPGEEPPKYSVPGGPFDQPQPGITAAYHWYDPESPELPGRLPSGQQRRPSMPGVRLTIWAHGLGLVFVVPDAPRHALTSPGYSFCWLYNNRIDRARQAGKLNVPGMLRDSCNLAQPWHLVYLQQMAATFVSTALQPGIGERQQRTLERVLAPVLAAQAEARKKSVALECLYRNRKLHWPYETVRASSQWVANERAEPKCGQRPFIDLDELDPTAAMKDRRVKTAIDAFVDARIADLNVPPLIAGRQAVEEIPAAVRAGGGSQDEARWAMFAVERRQEERHGIPWHDTNPGRAKAAGQAVASAKEAAVRGHQQRAEDFRKRAERCAAKGKKWAGPVKPKPGEERDEHGCIADAAAMECKREGGVYLRAPSGPSDRGLECLPVDEAVRMLEEAGLEPSPELQAETESSEGRSTAVVLGVAAVVGVAGALAVSRWRSRSRS